MADILDINAAQSVKIIGANASGVENTPLDVDTDGRAKIAIAGRNDVTNIPVAVDLDGGVFVKTKYEKIIPVVLNSAWMNLAVYDQIETTVSLDGETISLDFKEDTFLIGNALITFISELSWSFILERYINEDDGSQLLDDDDTSLFLE